MAFWLIALVVVSIIQAALSYYLRPKVQKRGPGELQAPFCEQGQPIAYVAGCVRKRGTNVVWRRKPSSHSTSGGGYNYFCDMQLAICLGTVDRIRRIWFGQDAVPTVQVIYSRGSGFQTHNVVNLTSITSSLHPPYPAGDAAVVGNQDSHIGTIVMIATGANKTEWNHPDIPFEGVPAGWFAVYSAYTSSVSGNVDEGYELHDPKPGYIWTLIRPAKNDTINKDGAFCRFDGAQWQVESPTATPARQAWKVGIDNEEQNLKINGQMRWYEGSEDQPADPYLQKMARNGSAATPSYSGLCYVVFAPHYLPANIGANPNFKIGDGFFWGQSNTIPDPSFEIQRIPDPLGLKNDGGTDRSCPSTTAAPAQDNGSSVCSDANPANVIFEWLTSPVMGIGVPASDVDVASFRDAGRILFHEGIGQSFDLDQQASFDEVVKEVLMVTDGVVYEDPTTGLWTYRLIREPISEATAALWDLEGNFYTRNDWLTFDEDDFEGVPEFTRGSWGDVANQIKVQFTDRSEGYAQRVVDVQDIANYQAQGELVTIQNTYNSVFSRDLAIRLAYRDLRTLGYPRARLKDRMNRRGWDLRPGDCFIVTRPTLGISNMRFRVISIRYGTLMDGGIEIEAVEDVFGMPDTVYSEPGSGWVDPSTIPPVPPAAIRAWEIAYNTTRDSSPRVGFAALVARGDEDTTGAVLWAGIGSLVSKIGAIGYTPSGILTSALVVEERTASIQLQGVTDFDALDPEGLAADGNNLVLIDDELIAFDAIGQNTDGSIYLSGCLRGVLDSIPRKHSVAARAWIIRKPPPVQAAITTVDHSETFKIQAVNAGGETDILSQPLSGGNTASRALRPIVPGKFRVGAAADLPQSLTDRVQVGDLAVSWVTRNRLTQAPGAVAQDAASIVPEVGQKTRVELIQGVSRIFQLVGMDGKPWPLGLTTTIGTASPWAVVKGSTWYLDNGIGAWPDVPVASQPSAYYIGINMATMVVELVTVRPAAWVDLYQVGWYGSGADLSVIVTDLRAKTTRRTADVTTEADTITVADLSAPASSLVPFHEELRAVGADGKLSIETRETGELFAAGVGLNMGNLMGGN